MAPPRRKFSTVGNVGVDVAGDAVTPPPPPVMSDIPSKDPSNIGHSDAAGPASDDGDQADEMDFSLAGLLAGRPDPELDLVTRSYALPRYVVEGLRMEHVRTRAPIQSIVAQALRRHLPAQLLEATRAKAERG